MKNNLDFTTFVELCEYCNDGTSKDMRESNKQKEHMLYKIWDWCQLNYNKSGFAYQAILSFDSIYNQELSLDKNDWLTLEEGLNKSFDLLNKNYYKANKKRLILDSMILYEFIFEKRLDDISKNKSCEIKEFNMGVSLGIDFLFRLQKHLKIQNPRKCLQFLRDVNLLRPIPTKIGKKNSYIGIHSYIHKTFTIHYAVSTIQSWFESLESMTDQIVLVGELELKRYLNSFPPEVKENFSFRKNAKNMFYLEFINIIISRVYNKPQILPNIFFIDNTAKFQDLTTNHKKYLTTNFKILLDLGGIPLKKRLEYIQKTYQKTVNIRELIIPLIT
jgi:hypothetical protein